MQRDKNCICHFKFTHKPGRVRNTNIYILISLHLCLIIFLHIAAVSMLIVYSLRFQVGRIRLDVGVAQIRIGLPAIHFDWLTTDIHTNVEQKIGQKCWLLKTQFPFRWCYSFGGWMANGQILIVSTPKSITKCIGLCGQVEFAGNRHLSNVVYNSSNQWHAAIWMLIKMKIFMTIFLTRTTETHTCKADRIVECLGLSIHSHKISQ